MINQWFRKIPVRHRIVGGFLTLILFAALSGLLLITNQFFLVERLQQATNVEARADRLLLLASARVESSRINLARYTGGLTPSPFEARDDVTQAVEFLQEAQSIVASSEQQTDIQLVLDALTEYEVLIDDVETITQESGSESANQSVFQTYRLGNDIGQRIEQTVSDSEIRLAGVNKTVFSEARTRMILFVIISALLFVFSLFLSWVVSQSITRPVQELQRSAEAFKQGQLNTVITVNGSDELSMLSTAFNEMTTQLSGLIGELEQRVADRTHALETSTDVGRSLSTILDVEDLTSEVVNQIQRAFDYYHVHIYLVDRGSKNLMMAGGTGKAGRKMLDEAHYIEPGQGLVGTAASSNTPVLVSDVSQESAWLPNPLLPDTKSELAVPISIGDDVLGVLDVQHSVQNGFQESDKALLQSIANQVAIALQNARLYQQTQEGEARTRTILESINVPLVISSVSTGIVLYLNEPLAETIRLPRESLIGQLTPDFYQDPDDRQGYLLALREKGFVDNYELRLKRGDGDPFWALISGRIIKFHGEPAVITSLLDITERRKSRDDLSKRAAEMATVAQVGMTAATIRETDKLLHEVVKLTKERFNLYHAHIYLLNEQQDTLLLTAGAGEVGRQMVAEKRKIPLNQERSLVAQAARSKQGVIENDTQRNLAFLPHPLLPNTRSEMAVPMIFGEEVIGVVDVQADEINRFTEQDVQIQMTLAAQTAVALQNARALEKAERAVSQLNTITKRLTREGWDQHLTRQVGSRLVYGYDLNQVNSLPSDDLLEREGTIKLLQPINVQGQQIGSLTISDPQELTEEAKEIIATVSEQLAAHIENLRLTEQTENALARTETLYAGSERVIRAESMQDILLALINSTDLQYLERASILLFDKPWDQNPENLTIFANWSAEPGVRHATIGTSFPVGQIPALNLLQQSEILMIEDIEKSVHIDEETRALLKGLEICSMFAFRFSVGDQWFGIVTGQSSQPVYIDDEAIRQIKGLTDQAAVVAQSLRLFEEAQERARREQLLREVTTRIHAAPDAESILRTAAQEVNRALGLEAFVYLEETDLKPAATNGNGSNNKE